MAWNMKKIRNGLVRGLEWLLILMIILLTLDVLWGVFSRFVLGSGLAHKLLGGIIAEENLGQAPYTDELACVLLVWVSMIGSAVAFGKKAHLGVDFFMLQLDPHARKVVFAVVQIIVIALTLVIFCYGGWKLSMAQMEQELATMPCLTRGQVYVSLPLAGIFILMFSIENLVEIIKTPAEKLGVQTQSEG